MANIVISGDTSGSVTLSAPAVSGTTVLTLPTTSGTLVVTGGAQTIEFADGTVSAPSITNSGDTNTGIYFPAADTIAFTEGGVESMRVDSVGFVGIGTNSPATKLHVNTTTGGVQVRATSDTDVSFSATATAADSTAFMTIINDARQWTMRVNGAESDQFQVRDSTAGATRMVIDSSGNVGIGTTSVSSTSGFTKIVQIFDATSSTLVTSGGGVTAEFACSSGGGWLSANGANPMRFATDGSERMRITSSGNLLVGSTSATAMSSLVAAGQAVQFGTRTFIGSNSGGDSGLGGLAGSNETILYVDATRSATFTTSGITLVQSLAQKSTGTAWTNPSDIRLKDEIQDYEKGLPELMQVQVKTWKYNGKGNTVEGSQGLGVIADEVMQVLPDSVSSFKAKLNSDDADLTDIKNFDATEITWLLVNAVKEQQAIITQLQADVAALKGAK